jgi:hypothetical protein
MSDYIPPEKIHLHGSGGIMLRLHRAWIVAFALSVACSEPTTPASRGEGPPPPPKLPDVITMTAASIREVNALPGSTVDSPPSVRIFNVTAGAPDVGVTVVFDVRTPDGSGSSQVSVTTGSNGVATLPQWKVGTAAGTYSVTARVDIPVQGTNQLDFFAYVRGKVIAIYDLIAFEGEPFPGSYVSEGHYVLFDDGTYNRVYNQAVSESTVFSTVDGTFTKDSAGVISFFLNPLHVSAVFGSLFAEGVPTNGKLRVIYSDFIDFDVEIYTLR